MLLRSSVDGVLCITQPSHAWVSGQLARVWGNQEFGQYFPTEEVCLAAEQHDIGWLSWEQAPTFNPKTGYPHRFTEVPTNINVGLRSQAKHLAEVYGRYVTLLVSLHCTGLYERHRSWENSASASIVKDFLDREYVFQQQLTKLLQQDSRYAPDATTEAIARNRQLIATWDSLSLLLCYGVKDKQQLEGVPTANGLTTLTLSPVADDPLYVQVSPWPFSLSKVTIFYEGRLLHQTYSDETSMREALHNAPYVTVNTILIPN